MAIKVTRELGIKCSFCRTERIGKNMSMTFFTNGKDVICSNCAKDCKQLKKEVIHDNKH